jgi:hypothetical protein
LLEVPLGDQELEVLIDLEDEQQRRAGFQRVFPSLDDNSMYVPLFDFERFHNTLCVKYLEMPSADRHKLLSGGGRRPS